MVKYTKLPKRERCKMAVKLTISLNEQVLEELDTWCANNGNLKRSHAIAFMTTQWLQAQKNMNMLGDMVTQFKSMSKENFQELLAAKADEK